jgi:hypothetical protein
MAMHHHSVLVGVKFLEAQHPACDERTGLSFAAATDLRQRGHSGVRVPRNSCAWFTVSDFRLPQLGGPGPRIYITQE